MLSFSHLTKHDSMDYFNTNNKKRSLFAFLSVFSIFLLSFNGASIFSVKIPSLHRTTHSPEKVAANSRNLISVPSSSQEKDETPTSEASIPGLKLETYSTDIPVAVAGAEDPINFVSVPFFKHLKHPQRKPAPVKEQHPHPHPHPNPHVNSNSNPNSHFPHVRRSHSLSAEPENPDSNFPESSRGNKKLLKVLASLGAYRGRRGVDFPARVKEHFSKKSDSGSCKVRFFMTWIAPLNAFTERAFHSIESIFKTHPDGCLLIVSNSLDSVKGRKILKPFSDNGYRVTAISPDFDYLFKTTMAESWFSRLVRGHVHAGDVPLGQNISNLLRFCLLYKYGGVYIDTDIIVLKSFSKLRNSIGAQTIDPGTKNWSRLNNAVMVFDKMHPLLYKFIEEFALTFNGNKWGHNGPYLVSRVVQRLQGRPGYNFTVLPPIAFYPVNWDKIRIIFRQAKNETDSRWLKGKLDQIRNQSYTIHLWNKQSRGLHVEQGSIVKKILSEKCVFCTAINKDYIDTTMP